MVLDFNNNCKKIGLHNPVRLYNPFKEPDEEVKKDKKKLDTEDEDDDFDSSSIRAEFKPSKHFKWDMYQDLPDDSKGNKICPLCGKSLAFIDGEIDHIIPVTAGATDKQIVHFNSLNNLQFVHKLCNRKKGTKILAEALKICRR